MVTLERREVKMSHGKQICVDYVKCDFNEVRNGQWMLELMRYAVKNAKVREVHSHVEEFDGSESPPGFAAVVLLDESKCDFQSLKDFPATQDGKSTFVSKLPAAKKIAES